MMPDVNEIELYQANEGELAQKDPDAYRWLLHNFDAIKRLLEDQQRQITALTPP